jgi:hypothetical protein
MNSRAKTANKSRLSKIFLQRGKDMYLHFRILIPFLAFCAFAAHEDISKSSAPFSFVQTGVINQVNYSTSGMSFSYKRIVGGKEGMLFSWSLPKSKTDVGKMSLYTVSGKLLKSFTFSSDSKPYVSWNGPNGKLAGGVYLAALSFGQFKKTLRVLY